MSCVDLTVNVRRRVHLCDNISFCLCARACVSMLLYAGAKARVRRRTLNCSHCIVDAGASNATVRSPGAQGWKSVQAPQQQQQLFQRNIQGVIITHCYETLLASSRDRPQTNTRTHIRCFCGRRCFVRLHEARVPEAFKTR